MISHLIHKDSHQKERTRN